MSIVPVTPGQHFVHSLEVGWQGWREEMDEKRYFFLCIPFMLKMLRWRELGGGRNSAFSNLNTVNQASRWSRILFQRKIFLKSKLVKVHLYKLQTIYCKCTWFKFQLLNNYNIGAALNVITPTLSPSLWDQIWLNPIKKSTVPLASCIRFPLTIHKTKCGH